MLFDLTSFFRLQGGERKILDDAFLMVTQANWEDDVIWNGDDIKHKVLQKLNSKSNAAGKLNFKFLVKSPQYVNFQSNRRLGSE